MTKQERDKQYREENKERIRAQRHEYYMRNREQIIQKNREYFLSRGDEIREKMRERARKNWSKRSAAHKQWYQENKEQISARNRQRYHDNKEEYNLQARIYREKNREIIAEKREVARMARVAARKMCPAFQFVDKIRLANKELYVTKYRPESNLAHRAKCPAIVAGDYSMCPICKDCSMSGKQMEKLCPMPHVFEFENAVAAIREYAADIVMANQK